ncbi:MAG: ATP-binding cassette domain-containing protein, partial [Planctomycetes bacterium]|nr:ATP-binding cassette domain-containing protein [Planctomycetota bacterium]
GVRHDLAIESDAYMAALVGDFTGGQLKIAPEHLAERVLRLMRKTPQRTFETFLRSFNRLSLEAGKEQYVIPYLMSGFPGCTDDDMKELAAWLRRRNWRPQQVQSFIPTPGTVATAMFYTQQDQDGRPIFVARTDAERLRQHYILVPDEAPPPAEREEKRPQRPERSTDSRSRSAGPRSGPPRGDRPRSDRPRSDRPRGDWSKSDRPRSDRPRSDRPQTDRPRSDRPRGDWSKSDRPRGERPRSDRPFTRSGSDRPRGEWQKGDRPRPTGPRSDRPRGDGYPRPRPQGDRPATERSGSGAPYNRDQRPRPVRPSRPYNSDSGRFRSRRDKPSGPPRRDSGPRPNRPEPSRTARRLQAARQGRGRVMTLLSANNLLKSFGGHTCFEDVSFIVPAGGRVGLIGPNGCGKTTLFRVLAGEDDYEGDLSRRRGLEIARLDQSPEFPAGATPRSVMAEAVRHWRELDAAIDAAREDLAVLSGKELDNALQHLADMETRRDAGDGESATRRAEALLRGVGLRLDQFDQDMETLSGGERCRVALARLLVNEPDLWLLDEPTNHLDLAGIAFLERFLRNSAAAAVIISHDRQFLNNVTTETWELEDGRLLIYPGNYSQSRKLREERRQAQWREFMK